LKAANLPFAAFHLSIGCEDPAEARKQFRASCRLARVSTVPVVTIAAAPLGCDFDAEVYRLAEWLKLAETEGVILTVETAAATVTADPLGAIELCRRVPGLALTLDPSHYHAGPHHYDYDALYPHVRHVRLRDTGNTPEQFQVRIGQGEIEYGKIISHLDRCHYDRALTVDIRDVPDSPFPVEPELRKLKYLLESLV
jgi:sugar phosphate isomerase/epimerase